VSAHAGRLPPAGLGVAVLGVETHICSKGAQMLPILPTATGQMLPALLGGQALTEASLQCCDEASKLVQSTGARSRRTCMAGPSTARARWTAYNGVATLTILWQLSLSPVRPLAATPFKRVRLRCSTPSGHKVAAGLRQAALP